MTALLAVLAAGCAKEGTPGMTDGMPREAVISVTLPEAVTKTALGEKAGGKYPTIWQEGDSLQLNGYASLPLSSEAAGAKEAGFVFRDGLSAPFNLLYPVSGEKDLVVFPSVQYYAEGSFDPAAAPMWGTSESYADVTLRHFSSLVKITLSAERPITLGSITLTALGGEPICGSFRAGMDGEGAFDGSLNVESGSPRLLYCFGEEGLELGAGETAVAYVSIPSGTYSAGFNAVVKTASYECRRLKFFTSGRNVADGKVLEFPSRGFDECEIVWEYYVSATGDGEGLDENDPMSIDAMLSMLKDPDGKGLDKATFHFTPGVHSITSPISLPGKDSYSGDLSYVITGDGRAVLDGGGRSQIFEIGADNSHVRVESITLTGGSSTESGGLVAIHDAAPLFVNCSFTDTRLTADKISGGAVRVDTAEKGSGTFEDCKFSGNFATGGGGALVITNPGTALSLKRCTFEDNGAGVTGGGAIYTTNGITELDDCIFLGNWANSAAGAVYITTGTVWARGCRFLENYVNSVASKGGAVDISAAGTFYGDRCYFRDNYFDESKMSANNTAGLGFDIKAETAGSTLCLHNCTVQNTRMNTNKSYNLSNCCSIASLGYCIVVNSTLHGNGKNTGRGCFSVGYNGTAEGDSDKALFLSNIAVHDKRASLWSASEKYSLTLDYNLLSGASLASRIIDGGHNFSGTVTLGSLDEDAGCFSAPTLPEGYTAPSQAALEDILSRSPKWNAFRTWLGDEWGKDQLGAVRGASSWTPGSIQ